MFKNAFLFISTYIFGHNVIYKRFFTKHDSKFFAALLRPPGKNDGLGLEGDHDRFLPNLLYHYHVMLRNRCIDKRE